MDDYSRATLRTTWLLLALGVLLYSTFALLTPPLADGPESMQAEAAREMLQGGDFLRFTSNAAPVPNASPLLVWGAATAMQLFGVGTSPVRLPLGLVAIAIALATAAFARRCLGSEQAALYAGVVILLSPGLFLATRTLVPTALACLWLVVALGCFWQTELRETGGSSTLAPSLGFAVACVLCILGNTPAIILVALATVVLYLLATRGLLGALRRLIALHPVTVVAVFVGCAAPWYALQRAAAFSQRFGTASPFAVWRGQPLTFLSLTYRWPQLRLLGPSFVQQCGFHLPHLHAARPLLIACTLPLLGLLPWNVFLPGALAAIPWQRIVRRPAAQPLQFEHRVPILLLLAAVLPLLCLVFSPRAAYAALPSLPFLAILIGSALDREIFETETTATPLSSVRAGLILLYGGGTIALLCGFLAIRATTPLPGMDLVWLLRLNPIGSPFAPGFLFHLDPVILGLFRDAIVLGGIAALLGAAATWWLRHSGQPYNANIALAAGTLLALVAIDKGIAIAGETRSSASLAAAVAPSLLPSSLLVVNGDEGAAATLAFYLSRNTVHILAGTSPFASNVETPSSFSLKWRGPQRVFLWTTPGTMPVLPSLFYVVASGGGKQILSNQKAEAFVVTPNGADAFPTTEADFEAIQGTTQFDTTPPTLDPAALPTDLVSPSGQSFMLPPPDLTPPPPQLVPTVPFSEPDAANVPKDFSQPADRTAPTDLTAPQGH